MRLRIALAAAAVSLALPAAASANTYCVNKSACLLGTAKPTVQDALDAAALHDGPDVVRIGASSEPYSGAFSYDEPAYNPVRVIGDGIGETILAASSTAPALQLGHGGSKVSGVTLIAHPLDPSQTQSVGVELDGADAENLSVVYRADRAGAVGVLTKGDADLLNVDVDVPAGTGVLAMNGPQGTTIEDAHVAAWFGVFAKEGSTATLRDVAIEAGSEAAAAFQGSLLRLSNVLITTARENGIGTGVQATGGSSVTANHVTMADTATATYGKGVVVEGGSVSLRNTIVEYPTPVLRRYAAGYDSDLDLRYSNVDLAASDLNEPTVPGQIVQGPAVGYQPPRFASELDFHLRGDSPLIDVGEVTPLSNETDLDGLDRDADGDGDQAYEVDLGAFEYQRRPPFAAFATGPAIAGTPVGFEAAASSDPDPGDAWGFAYEWSFGDGTTGSGQNPQHAYAGSGEYTVVLTVTDPAGLKDTATQLVSVGAAPPPPAPAGPASPAADSLAPAITRLKVLPRRGRARFRLSEPARVTLRIVPIRSPKRVRVLKLNGHSGLNAVRLRRRVMRPGAYRLVVRATDPAGNRARPARVRFRLRNP